MLYDATLLSYPDWRITLTVHTDNFYKILMMLLVRIINLLHYYQEK